MTVTSDPHRLFTERADAYDRFTRAVMYPQGLHAFFLESALLRPQLRVLDAGCGTGVLTLALRDALVHRGLALRSFHGFDLTPAMLDRFRMILQRRAIEDVTLTQANVLDLAALPSGWTDYDLVVSASMLEYVPRTQLGDALKELRSRLAQDGQFVLFITRRNPLLAFSSDDGGGPTSTRRARLQTPFARQDSRISPSEGFRSRRVISRCGDTL